MWAVLDSNQRPLPCQRINKTSITADNQTDNKNKKSYNIVFLSIMAR